MLAMKHKNLVNAIKWKKRKQPNMKEKIYHQQGEKTLIYQEKREEPSRQRAKTDDLNLDGQKIVSCPSRAGAKTKQGSENSMH